MKQWITQQMCFWNRLALAKGRRAIAVMSTLDSRCQPYAPGIDGTAVGRKPGNGRWMLTVALLGIVSFGIAYWVAPGPSDAVVSGDQAVVEALVSLDTTLEVISTTVAVSRRQGAIDDGLACAIERQVVDIQTELGQGWDAVLVGDFAAAARIVASARKAMSRVPEPELCEAK